MKESESDVNLNGLDKETVRKALLQYNYFPRQHDHKEELPPIFHSVGFTPEVAEQLLQNTRQRRLGYDNLPFRRTRHPNIPRMMSIPHPRAYAELVNVIAENWDKLAAVCQSPNSQLEFGLQEDGRIVVHRYDHTASDGEVEDQDPLSDFGKSYRIKTDINNFYHSIYSHSLPWALVGHDEAKRHKGPQHNDIWYNQIDKAVMLCQRSETKGMPIGPATSTLLSEVIMNRVDAALRDRYQFTRYIDDYMVYVDSRDEGDQFLIDLSHELEKYALTLNLKKTFVSQMPVLNREEWITDINLFFGSDDEAGVNEEGLRAKLKYRQLRLIIDKAVALSKEFPDGSVIKYAFSAIIEIGIRNEGFGTDDEAGERYFEDALLRYAYYFPTLIPLIQRWLPHFPSCDRRVEERVKQRVVRLLDRSFDLAQSDNIVWCIYYLLQMSAEAQNGLVERCIKSNDPMVILMGYVYVKRFNLSTDQFRCWALEIMKKLKDESHTEYDVDRVWLVFYQLYFDDIIDYPPYQKADDNNVFKLLKEKGVSFVDFQHDDFGKRALNHAKRIFGDLLDEASEEP